MVQKRLNTYRLLRGKSLTATLAIRRGPLPPCQILLDGARLIVPSLNECDARTNGAVAANQEPGLIRCQSKRKKLFLEQKKQRSTSPFTLFPSAQITISTNGFG
jgi:hypothetical protein